MLGGFVAVISGGEIVSRLHFRWKTQVCQPRNHLHLTLCGRVSDLVTSEVRHSFAPCLAVTAVSHTGFPTCNAGTLTSPLTFMIYLWVRYSIFLSAHYGFYVDMVFPESVAQLSARSKKHSSFTTDVRLWTLNSLSSRVLRSTTPHGDTEPV